MPTDVDPLDGRVLVLAPIGRDASLIGAALTKDGASSSVCSDFATLADELERGAGAVIVTEESLDDDGLSLLVRRVRGQPPWSDLPFIVLTSADRVGQPADTLVEKLAVLGNVTFLERPVRMMTLLSAARSALRARHRQYEVRDHLAERERVTRDLQERAEQTEHENRAKDEFLAMLGHELRNPIAAIGAAVEVLEGLEPLDGSTEPLAVIGRQVHHLARLVDDLLDVSRVSNGRIVLSLRPVDLGALAERCASALPAARQARQRISVVAKSTWVQGDETRLEQIVSNLLGNAIKYTPEDGRIELRVEGRDGHALLSVRDSGMGIPAELLPRIFDLFVQDERSIERAQGGLGVGLTLVRRLVGLHGGTVEATSGGAGRGSMFMVRLPEIAHAAAPATRTASNGHGRTPDGPLTLLLVEDNPDMREMMAMLLRLRSHDVHEVGDGASAVATALSLAPDVAIVDVGLPELDGYEVARRVRSAPGGQAITLIALTGYGQPEDRQRALDAGFDAHFVKPVSLDALESALRRRAS